MTLANLGPALVVLPAMVQIAGPATYTTYLKAARRLQLPEDAAG